MLWLAQGQRWNQRLHGHSDNTGKSLEVGLLCTTADAWFQKKHLTAILFLSLSLFHFFQEPLRLWILFHYIESVCNMSAQSTHSWARCIWRHLNLDPMLFFRVAWGYPKWRQRREPTTETHSCCKSPDILVKWSFCGELLNLQASSCVASISKTFSLRDLCFSLTSALGRELMIVWVALSTWWG